MQELLYMVQEDLQNPTIDTSGISNLLYFDKFDVRKMILYYDLVFILGSIAYNVFDYDKNALNHTEDGQHGAINMSEMLTRGYNELVAVKRTNGHAAYGSTLIFTTVLEAELKRKFKLLVIDDLLAAVQNTIQNGSFLATPDDQTLIDCLSDARNDYNSVYVLTDGADDLLTRTNVYSNAQEQRALMLNKTTLNQLIQSIGFQNKAEPVFVEIMKYLFGTNNLNLRNDIAHGGFGYQNYYHTAGAGLLYLLVNAVVKNFWKKYTSIIRNQ